MAAAAVAALTLLLLVVTRASPASSRTLHPTTVEPSAVRVVHVVASNHLDLGFCDYATNILNRNLVGEWGTAAPPAPRNAS
eukprot:gene42103-66435_t